MQFQDKQAKRQLQLLQQIIHRLPHGLVVISLRDDSRFKICLANEELYTKSGYTEFDLIGSHINKVLDSFLHERHIKHLERWAQDPVVIDFADRHSSLEMLCKDGSKIQVGIKIFPLYENEDGYLIQMETVNKSKVYGAAALIFK